jgi:protoporphyrinogen oxidase
MTARRDPGRVLILGAGPTGLGAAYRLQELGFDNFQILESAPSSGGLAASVVDSEGFTWDLGGHVQFSHYAYYDDVLDTALAGEWLWHDRESWVWLRDRFVPYPFQNNIHRLEREDMEHALRGLEQAAAQRRSKPAVNFGDWIHTTFGEGIAQMFLYPYNFKVWGVPPEHMGVGWMGERVAIPDIERSGRTSPSSAMTSRGARTTASASPGAAAPARSGSEWASSFARRIDSSSTG